MFIFGTFDSLPMQSLSGTLSNPSSFTSCIMTNERCLLMQWDSYTTIVRCRANIVVITVINKLEIDYFLSLFSAHEIPLQCCSFLLAKFQDISTLLEEDNVALQDTKVFHERKHQQKTINFQLLLSNLPYLSCAINERMNEPLSQCCM